MKVAFNEKNKVFSVETENTGYYFGIADDEKFLGHIHFGKKISSEDELVYKLRADEWPLSPSVNNRERLAFNDNFAWEYPAGGRGDFRESCLEIINEEGQNCCELHYDGYEILNSKPALEGLPATFAEEKKCQTLIVKLTDEILNIEVQLFYSVFENIDAVAKSVKIINKGNQNLKIKKAYSSCLNLENGTESNAWEFVSLHGGWAKERNIEKTPLFHGRVNVNSKRGETGAQENNFYAVAQKNADYKTGEVYGSALVYSGNFIGQAEVGQFENVRLVSGINADGFLWTLNPGNTFTTPEAVLVYSDEGFGKMSRRYHDLWRNHLIRGKYKNIMRPVLINNWEATYFDFNTEKLLQLADEAARDGIEMLVMDDGWFGKRNKDDCSLGDWIVNEEKLKGGLKYLVDEVNKRGLKFGIWFEPEMLSFDSDIYRAHPDWAIQVKDRTPVLSRAQLVFDLTNPDVFNYIYLSVAKILRSANIEYVKWDMNRQLTDVGSSLTSGDSNGEFYHRYVLAVYALQEKLLQEFPYLLLENCSAGGNRFDAGMLYYSPQIWTSDDCDAIERLAIHEGTSLCYPLSTMGSHVAVCPNHTCGRTTPFLTRGYVALSGTFGYELDITKLSEDEKKLIPQQIEMFKKYNPLVMHGDYYRLESARGDCQFDTWECVSKDKKNAVLVMIQVLNRPNFKSRFVKLEGLLPEQKYSVQIEDSFGNKRENFSLSGNTLMNLGLRLERMHGDFAGYLVSLQAE